MGGANDLLEHLATGATCVCRCWAVIRRDGEVFGFTDHDAPLSFEGIRFRADAGMTARALQQSTGLSVDNTEALGILSDSSVSEADIAAGRFDGAEVLAWLVNWSAPEQRMVQFRGHIGEIQRVAGAFQAELRGLSESLNQPTGRAYQKPCSAVLGDARCGVDLSLPGYSLETSALEVRERKFIRVPAASSIDPRWFERGQVEVLSGAARALCGVIKNDRILNIGREIELWEALGAELAQGDQIRLIAGCDKRSETCRTKFSNFINFQGFPHIPGEDWLMGYPAQYDRNDGGSLVG